MMLCLQVKISMLDFGFMSLLVGTKAFWLFSKNISVVIPFFSMEVPHADEWALVPEPAGKSNDGNILSSHQ